MDHMQTICTLLQTDNHTNTSSPNFLLNALPDNQQCQSTEGNKGRKNGKWLNKVHFKMAMTLEVV